MYAYRRFLITAAALTLAACSSSKPSASTSSPTLDIGSLAQIACSPVPQSFLMSLDLHDTVAKSSAVDSGRLNTAGRDVYEVAVRFTDGAVAVWSTAGSIAGGGPVIPMNAAARRHSDMGVDIPATAPIVPDDPSDVQLATNCVS